MQNLRTHIAPPKQTNFGGGGALISKTRKARPVARVDATIKQLTNNNQTNKAALVDLII
jgi:hypothetical protein